MEPLDVSSHATHADANADDGGVYLSTSDGFTARTLVASGETVATAHSLNQPTLHPFNRQL